MRETTTGGREGAGPRSWWRVYTTAGEGGGEGDRRGGGRFVWAEKEEKGGGFGLLGAKTEDASEVGPTDMAEAEADAACATAVAAALFVY